jgi:hypothetical protein
VLDVKGIIHCCRIYFAGHDIRKPDQKKHYPPTPYTLHQLIQTCNLPPSTINSILLDRASRFCSWRSCPPLAGFSTTRPTRSRQFLQDPRLFRQVVLCSSRIWRCVLSVFMEEAHELLHAKFASSTLTTFNSLVRQFALLFLKVQNTFFNGVFDGNFVDNNINLLS